MECNSAGLELNHTGNRIANETKTEKEKQFREIERKTRQFTESARYIKFPLVHAACTRASDIRERARTLSLARYVN